VQVTTIFICWRLTRVNDCVLTWPTLKETADMLSMTTSEWAQLRTNTDSFLWEDTVEPQVSTIMENFGRKCLSCEVKCHVWTVQRTNKPHGTIDAKCPIIHARPKFWPRGLVRMASFNISGFRTIKTWVCWCLQGMNRHRPLHLPYDMIRYEMLF